jgi:hypothetical protein
MIGRGAAAGEVEETPAAPAPEVLAEKWERWEEQVGVEGRAAEGVEGLDTRRQQRESRATREREAPPVNREQASPRSLSGAAGETEAAQQNSRTQGMKRRPATIMRENLLPRVEKMREASIVVLEEASDDSGIRFVLIAVVLFLLFLLFLFISSFLR